MAVVTMYKTRPWKQVTDGEEKNRTWQELGTHGLGWVTSCMFKSAGGDVRRQAEAAALE